MLKTDISKVLDALNFLSIKLRNFIKMILNKNKKNMKKLIISIFLSGILTIIMLVILNSIWLERFPVEVNLDIKGDQIVNIVSTLGSSKNDKVRIDLKSQYQHKFMIKKKGGFKEVHFYIQGIQNESDIIISKVFVNKNELKINDVTIKITGANYQINENNLILTPISDSVEVFYSINKTYPKITFKLFKFLELSILFFSILFIIIYYKEKILNFIIYLFPNKISDNLNFCFISVSVSIILFLFTLFLLSYIGFIFHIPIQKVYILVSFITVGIFLYLFNKKVCLSNKYILKQVILLIAIFTVSFLLGVCFYDVSWDGRCYHQEIIMLLSNGWNPIFGNPIFNFINTDIWVEHYPKCAEILSANFVKFFKNIEIGKVINFLFASSIFLLSLFTFNKFKTSKPLTNTFLSILIILNPVSIGQIRTYYVDLIVYYLFVGVIFAIILKEKHFITDKLFLFLTVSQLAMLSNIKLGGLFYSIILVFFFAIYSLFFRKTKNLKFIFKIISLLIVLILISGVNPYFTNIKQGHNPFYPLVGKGKVDIMITNSPKSFKNKNPLYKLFVSTFSDTDNITLSSETNPKLKIPFSVVNQGSSTYDTRIAGFGYFWSGILLLLIPFIILGKNSKDEDNKIYYFIVGTLCASVLFNPESWWARYVPQFWLIPIFIIFWKSLNWEQNSKLKKFGIFLIIILFVNSLIFEFQSLKTSLKFSKQRNEFFKEVKGKNVNIYINTSEKETLCNKLQKITNNLYIVSQSEYKNNEKGFKNIPSVLSKNYLEVGVYKINE